MRSVIPHSATAHMLYIYICMCVVNNQFEVLEFVFIPFMLTCIMMRFLSLLLLCLCPCDAFVVVVGLSVRFSWYPEWMRWLM